MLKKESTKNSLYRICDTLVEYRRQQTGLNNTIDIPLKIFEYDVREFGFDKIKNDLRILADSVTESGRSLFEITEHSLDNLTESNYIEVIIQVRYSKNDIKNFVKEMRESDKEISENQPDKIIVQAGLNYGSFIVKHQNEQMEIRLGKKDSAQYLNICLLLFGLPLSYICGAEVINYPPDERHSILNVRPDYVVGKTKLEYSVLYEYAIIKNEEVALTLPRKVKNKLIYYGIRYVNIRASLKLGFELFEHANSEYWVNEKIANKLVIKDLNIE